MEAPSEKQRLNYTPFGELPQAYIKHMIDLPQPGFVVDFKNITFEATKFDLDYH